MIIKLLLLLLLFILLLYDFKPGVATLGDQALKHIDFIHRTVCFGFGDGAFFSAVVVFVTMTHPSHTLTPAISPGTRVATLGDGQLSRDAMTFGCFPMRWYPLELRSFHRLKCVFVHAATLHRLLCSFVHCGVLYCARIPFGDHPFKLEPYRED